MPNEVIVENASKIYERWEIEENANNLRKSFCRSADKFAIVMVRIAKNATNAKSEDETSMKSNLSMAKDPALLVIPERNAATESEVL